MPIDEFVQLFPDVAIQPESIMASRFLERNGSRFLIDHGYENAASKAWKMIDPDGQSLEYSEAKLAEYRSVLGL